MPSTVTFPWLVKRPGLMVVGSRRENEIVAVAYIAEMGRGWLESLAIAHRAFEEADRYLKDSAGDIEIGTPCGCDGLYWYSLGKWEGCSVSRG